MGHDSAAAAVYGLSKVSRLTPAETTAAEVQRPDNMCRRNLTLNKQYSRSLTMTVQHDSLRRAGEVLTSGLRIRHKSSLRTPTGAILYAT